MGEHKKIAGIYEIRNATNNKVYVGYSENILKRWDNHKYKLRRNQSCSPHLQNAWNVYGGKSFIFSIIEVLPDNLSKQEYEEVETKWVLYFQSNKHEFGYNAVLPGNIPLINKDENITNRARLITSYICINLSTKEKVTIDSRRGIQEYTGVPLGKVSDMAAYWTGRGKRKSLKGWIIIKEEDYNSEFDYINYKKVNKNKLLIPKTWKDYEHTRKPKRKKQEDIIPYSERNLKRVSIIAVNVLTGEEKHYKMVKDCYNEFSQSKVQRCLSYPFGKYQHRGYYFKRAEV